LVDSSLDWGQDLPALRRYLEQHPGPAYLGYFGMDSPAARQIPAHLLFGYPGYDVPQSVQILEFTPDKVDAGVGAFLREHPDFEPIGGGQGPNGKIGVLVMVKPEALRLGPGTYYISASLLEPVMYDLVGPVGPWNARYENTYQKLRTAVLPLMSDDPATREGAIRTRPPSQWRLFLAYFDMYRFGRLTAWLRQREPADQIHHSILVYSVTQADLTKALDGPPPEQGVDEVIRAGISPPQLPFSL
jgi:hypothetical protein